MILEAETEVLAWHFTVDTLRDGRPIPAVGEWLVHEGPVEMCSTGLHASEKLWDALNYAPGPMLHRVTLRGDLVRDDDKLVGLMRRIEWSINAEPVLRAFARRCALDVLHLCHDAPAVVRKYLETGREDIRAAAWDAARAAAMDDAWDAARAAAWDAARAAAMDDAWDAAWDAARDAARAAAWGAAWGAAWDAARGVARDAAWGVAIEKYSGWLVEMVEAARSDQ